MTNLFLLQRHAFIFNNKFKYGEGGQMHTWNPPNPSPSFPFLIMLEHEPITIVTYLSWLILQQLTRLKGVSRTPDPPFPFTVMNT